MQQLNMDFSLKYELPVWTVRGFIGGDGFSASGWTRQDFTEMSLHDFIRDIQLASHLRFYFQPAVEDTSPSQHSQFLHHYSHSCWYLQGRFN